MSNDISQIKPDKKKALYLAKRELSVFICDAVNLEGINYTLPEIQTILDGVTVGGHKLSEQQVVVNQKNAWDALFNLIQNNEFQLNKLIACKLHSLAAYNDALTWGEFRNKEVTIAGTKYLPPKSKDLDTLFNKMIDTSNSIKDPFDKAIYVFLDMARNQYFFDVNKRMGRFMMNGMLLNEGYPAINVKAKDQLEFNTLMLEYYESNNMDKMNKFLKKSISAETIKFMTNNNKTKQQDKSI